MASNRFVLVLGGTGFIGSRIPADLVSTEWRVTVATRRADHARHLLPLPSIEDIEEADVHDDAALDRLVQGQDAVINLVGILHGKRGPAGSRYGPAFARAHVDLPRRVAAACARHGVRRLLHMSALGASANAPSMYFRSKHDGELAAQSQPAVAATIFRPSVVFGPEDHLLNLFARLQRWLPVMLIGRPDARFQPVYVDDVARAFVRALEEPRSAGRIYELGGPRICTLRELVQMAGRYSGHPRPVIGLPDALAWLQALLMEWLPGGPLMSRDNLASLRVDTVTAATLREQFGIEPTPIEAVAPRYLRPLKATPRLPDMSQPA
ncbi:MAG TPA: complex I NDUFA9 subunit family protein [Noviherbaspirillum sp.]|nr:complex I NDUFA9 subunit family protein [Noviherbaspirillum sp.]